jgi:hypothetical protein
VGVNHCGGNVFVPEKFLHGTDFLAVFKQMGGETMPPRKIYAYAVGLSGFFLR